MAKLVLVVDDDADVWMLLALRLQSFGYVMISAKNGEQGLLKAKELKPDLIFLDFNMLNENGLEVLKKLKIPSSDGTHEIPVIMLTAQGEYETQCIEAGAAGYITKPFDLFQLKETLSKFLPK